MAVKSTNISELDKRLSDINGIIGDHLPLNVGDGTITGMLEETVYTGESIEDADDIPYRNADFLANHPASYYATEDDLKEVHDRIDSAIAVDTSNGTVEIVDARKDNSGHSYKTLGASIRGQISELDKLKAGRDEMDLSVSNYRRGIVSIIQNSELITYDGYTLSSKSGDEILFIGDSQQVEEQEIDYLSRLVAPNAVTLTQEEYDALPESKLNDNTVYYIEDYAEGKINAYDNMYNNENSNLEATDVQMAIDELADNTKILPELVQSFGVMYDNMSNLEDKTNTLIDNLPRIDSLESRTTEVEDRLDTDETNIQELKTKVDNCVTYDEYNAVKRGIISSIQNSDLTTMNGLELTTKKGSGILFVGTFVQVEQQRMEVITNMMNDIAIIKQQIGV